MTRRRIVAATLLLVAFLAASAAAAAPHELMPGVTYERLERSTGHGPLVIHVVRAPRPGGLYSLVPVLANDTVVGREKVTSMQQRLSGESTMVGVNADFFETATGRPSGILLRDSALIHPPTGARASVGITADGLLDVQRIEFFGTWQGTGPRRPLDDLHQAPGPNGISLFTSTWGSKTPAVPGALVAVLVPLPVPAVNIDIGAPVIEMRRASGPVVIPPGGAVLVARGTAATRLQTEVAVGQEVVVSLLFRPTWPAVVNAVGGGPLIVRDGRAVFRAQEDFRSSQLSSRAPRTAVGQSADGRLLLVAVEGRSSRSVGVTNWELAQTLVRLGAVTAAAMDSGGSSTLAFDGGVLNTPSDARGERPVADGLMVSYQGVYLQPPGRAPDVAGGGASAPMSLRYKVVRPSLVTHVLTPPDGGAPIRETINRLPGSYDLSLPGDPTPASSTQGVPPGEPAQGKWKLAVEATDDFGRTSAMTGFLVVNRTVERVRTEPATLLVPPGGQEAQILWEQTRRGFVVATIEGRGGAVIRTLARQRIEPGPVTLSWNGLDRRGKRAPGGYYTVRVVVRNDLGLIETTKKFLLRQVPASE
jgi:exopolysaccharide biosynthesis protein